MERRSQATSEYAPLPPPPSPSPPPHARPIHKSYENRYTYLGQLVSHDMNQDASSTLGVPIDPSTLPNVNNPALDLDTIYSIDVSCVRI